MTFRVYYNRRGAEPWSVDRGSPESEQTCRGVVLCACYWQTREREGENPDPEGLPSAWIEVEATRAECIAGKIVFVP